MPKIPVYPAGGEVQQSMTLNAPKMNLNVSPDAFGAAQGRALAQGGAQMQKTGDLLMNRALELKTKNDDARVDEIFTQARMEAVETYNKKMLALEGKDALSLHKDLTEDFSDNFLPKFMDMADNETQKAALKKRMGDMGARLSGQAATVQAREAVKYRKNTLAASAEMDKQDAVENRLDSGYVADRLTDVKAKTRELYKEQDKEFQDIKVLEKTNEFHTGLLTTMLDVDDNPAAARAYLEKYGDEMTPGTKSKLAKAIDTKEDLKAGNEFGQNLFERGVGLVDGMKIIKQKFDGDEGKEKAALAEFKSWHSAKKLEDKQVYANNLIDTINEIDSLRHDPAAIQKKLNSMPVNTDMQRRLKKQAETRADRYLRDAGIDPGTQYVAYVDAKEAIESGAITTKEDLATEYGVDLASVDMKKMEKMLDAYQGRGEKGQFVMTKQLSDFYRDAIGKPTGVSLNKKEKISLREFLLDAEDKLKGTNRATDPEHLRALADAWVLDGELKKGEGRPHGKFAIGYGHNKTLNEVRKGIESGEYTYDDLRDWLPDIPDAAVDQNTYSFEAMSEAAQNAWITKYGGSKPYALRGYYKENLFLKLGKRGAK